MSIHKITPACGKPGSKAGSELVTENGRQILETRYLKKDENGRLLESPEDMFRRVARAIAKAEIPYGGVKASREAEEEFLESMTRLEFLPNSPTLMNAGRDPGQLSACFVLPIEDTLDSIFETVKNTALIHKSGGGTGFSFSRIRPKGNRVRSTHGVSSGPVSFMRVFDAATEAVKQGGARRGANMGVLRVDHPDIVEFIRAKADCMDFRNFNTSVAVSDSFLEAAERGIDFVTINPSTREPGGSFNAAEVFRAICRNAWECGDPGLLFIDRINRDNPTPSLGQFETTNPCGEQPLLPYESCNLGSINLSKMVTCGGRKTLLSYALLKRTIRMAVRFLDDVIDVNQYPLPRIKSATRGNRKIGLGVMGWADLLIKLKLPYDSAQALALAGQVMDFIGHTARHASHELALQRGPYPNFKLSTEVRRKKPYLQRNATLTTIAPTGTLSIIAGCSSGIEPLYALSYTRSHVLDGRNQQEMHSGLIGELAQCGLRKPGLLNEILKNGSIREVRDLPSGLAEKYRTALEIKPEWHVRMQAAFQRFCDNGVSKTVNLPFEASPEDVASVYRLAGELGCKGITVYRDRCREAQVLNAGCVACA